MGLIPSSVQRLIGTPGVVAVALAVLSFVAMRTPTNAQERPHPNHEQEDQKQHKAKKEQQQDRQEKAQQQKERQKERRHQQVQQQKQRQDRLEEAQERWEQEQDRREDAREQERRQQQRLSQQQQQQRIDQQRQRLVQYRRHLETQRRLVEQESARLQQAKRMAQYRFQQQYLERLRQQQIRIDNERNYDYDNDPYFYTPPSYRYLRDGRYYETNRYGAKLLRRAVNYGYREGFRAGEADRQDGWASGYRDSYAYRDANYGYNGYYVERKDYNHYFREGFARGYEDGYGSRYQYGSYSDGQNSILGNILAAILNLESLR